MALGVGSGMFAIVAPVEKTNLCTNSSFERGTMDWRPAAGGATIGTVSDVQQFGAWALKVTPTDSSLSAFYGSAGANPLNLGSGSAYTFSTYVRGAVGTVYALEIWPIEGGAARGGGSVTATGAWDQVSFQYTEGTTSNRALLVSARITHAGTPFYVDGVQAEQGSRTTYIDGDQEGCIWLGAPHNSQSQRSGQSRAGGSVIPLADLGFTANEYPGVGMPPVENSSLSYALVDGAQFQRQRAAARTFTLAASISGTANEGALAGLHRVRRTLIDHFKIDAVTPQQPVRFLYVGAGGTAQIDAVYDGGLEFDLPAESGYLENVAARFVAYDPYWRSPTQEGTALAALIGLGSVNYIVKRSPLGAWGTLGGAGVNHIVHDILTPETGTVFVGGTFTTIDGTAGGKYIGMYFPQTNVWGTLAGGTLDSPVFALERSAAGTLYAGGSFVTAGGTQARFIAQWNGAWGTLIGGTLAGGAVRALELTPTGTLFVGGEFTSIAGTAQRFAAQWVSAWGTLTNGSVNNTIVNTLRIGFDGKLYLGGDFDQAGGTAANAIAAWNGAWGTLSTALQRGGFSQICQSIAVAPDGRLVAGGLFGTAGGVAANSIAYWNNVAWTALGSGLQQTGATPPQGYRVLARSDSSIIAAGSFGTAGGIAIPNGLALWNGASWLPMDILLGGNGFIQALAVGLDQTLYVGGNFAGIGTAASVGTIVNTGKAQAFPMLRMRNTTASAVRTYQIRNNTTGDMIAFNLTLLAGEVAQLTLEPGARSFQSNLRGNIFGVIQPGSNLATFRLLPGTNYVSFLADNSNLEVSLFWQPRHWSADQG